MIVAIDGPAGAGKSTIAQEVAERLGFQLVDTGAIYRTLAWEARQREIPIEDAETLAELAKDLDFRFELADGRNRIYCNDRLRGDEIRTAANSQAASIVSAHPAVREALLDVQRRIGRQTDSVLEGRDIGTVVFPDADVKIFLTASPHERARRRVKQMAEKGQVADANEILEEIRIRDERDSKREAAPLKKADDAMEIDSTAFTIEEVVDQILDAVRRRES